MMREEEDEETLFDQEGLLGSGKKSSWDWDWVRRITKTLSLSLAFFALGLCISIPGATLLDLEERTNSSTEQISLIFSARSLGYLLGSIVGGVLFDYFDQQILLFYTLVLTGIATVAVPWCTALFVLGCMIAVQGMALGVLDTGGNMFCIKIWSKASPPYMQTLHFSFAVGAFLAPLLARPFLIGGGGALGDNTTFYTISHFPVNTRIPDLSGGGGTSGFQGNMHRLTQSADSWWLTDAGRYRAARDIEAEDDGDNGTTVSGVSAVTSFANVTGNASVVNTTIPTTTPPRAAKPVIADGSFLANEFANSDKAKEHILAHKDDQRTESADEAAASEEKPGANSHVETNDTNSLSDGGLSGDAGNVSDSVANQTGSGTQLEPEAAPNSTVVSTMTEKPTTTVPTPTTTTTTTTMTTTTTTTTTTTSTTSTTTTTTVSPTTAIAPETGKEQPVANGSSADSSVTPTPSTSTSTTTTTRKPKPQILDVISSTLDAMKHMSKIQFAYLIIGLILMADAVFFLALYCRDCKAGTLLHQVNALGPSPPVTSSCFRVSLLSMLFIFFLFYVGMEVAFGGLIATFAVESRLIQWSQRQGATLAALFWGSIAVGRGTAIFVARCFKPPCMLVIDLVFTLTGAVMLSFGLQATPVMLWVGTVMLGLGMSSIFPTAVSWADCYYPLTGRAAAVFITGSGVGEMVIPVVTGYLFEKLDSLWLMYMVLGLSGLVTLVFVGLQCLASRQPAPTSVSKLGFLPLHNEEENNIAMDDMLNGNTTGYVESTRRRQVANSHMEDAEEETTKLVDISE